MRYWTCWALLVKDSNDQLWLETLRIHEAECWPVHFRNWLEEEQKGSKDHDSNNKMPVPPSMSKKSPSNLSGEARSDSLPGRSLPLHLANMDIGPSGANTDGGASSLPWAALPPRMAAWRPQGRDKLETSGRRAVAE